MTRTPGAVGVRLLAETRDEIGRADSKASILLAVLGVSASGVIGLQSSASWSPHRLAAVGQLAWWCGLLALLTALAALLLAVLPRFSRNSWRPGRPLTHFQDIVDAADAGLLAQALAETEEKGETALLLALAESSRIVARKHRCIRAGLTAFGAALTLLLLGLLAG
ncbi:Pycsar system effector family protein [Streptacidiphilus jiangxiensis]|uniref:Pycsar system effector family protein n=1 Tax=Streptacidiphilus jiangxiensis TaxID=235985 RepID=UPI001F37D945|nr:Pycsar system effector family protein [Streptacidiphilus jiangxiensis]